MPVAQRMTAEEYLAIPYAEELRRTELVAGELVVHDPLVKHEMLCSAIQIELALWTREKPGRGMAIRSIDVLVGDHDVYGPDVLWFVPGREPDRDDPRPYGVPDLVAEVRSPSTWRYDIGAKKSGYERSGLGELWLVDSVAEEVLAFRRSGPRAPRFDIALELTRGDVLSSTTLPGFALALEHLFG